MTDSPLLRTDVPKPVYPTLKPVVVSPVSAPDFNPTTPPSTNESPTSVAPTDTADLPTIPFCDDPVNLVCFDTAPPEPEGSSETKETKSEQETKETEEQEETQESGVQGNNSDEIGSEKSQETQDEGGPRTCSEAFDSLEKNLKSEHFDKNDPNVQKVLNFIRKIEDENVKAILDAIDRSLENARKLMEKHKQYIKEVVIPKEEGVKKEIEKQASQLKHVQNEVARGIKLAG